MLLSASYTCAFCGERIETAVDPSGGRSQRWVEDCQVCCRPNVLHVSLEGGAARIDADPEMDRS